MSMGDLKFYARLNGRTGSPHTADYLGETASWQKSDITTALHLTISFRCPGGKCLERQNQRHGQNMSRTEGTGALASWKKGRLWTSCSALNQTVEIPEANLC